MDKTSYQHVSHDCIPIFINENSRYLILGSLPSVKSREEQFYYAHKRNRFFLTLANVFNEEEPISIRDRKEFLLRHNIALYDVIYECDIHASSDASIINVKPIDIESILKQYQNIKYIGVNGGKAKQTFEKYLLDKIGNGIKVFYLPSTSPANARTSQEELNNQYKELFIQK